MAVTNPITRARKKQALVYFQANQLADAKQLYAEVCKLDRRDADAWNMLGAIHGMQAEYADAEACCRQVIALQPGAMGTYNNLGNALKFQGKLAEAETAYRQALQLQPNYAEGYNNLGNLLKEQGKNEDAVSCYQRALQLQPNYAEAYNNLAGIFRNQNKTDEALACYVHALKLNPAYVDARFNLGSMMYKQGKKDEAQACFQQVLQRIPDHAEALMLLGGIYKEKGELAQAEAQFRRVLELNQDANARYMLATLGVEATPVQSPSEYVKDLFDGYAENFDEHLTKGLSYRTPELLFDALDPILDKEGKGLDVLDLGCGTGLCGPLFRNRSRRLVGVDLSPRMIDMAHKRNVYDELLVEDITITLSSSPSAYDLILSADVFVYIGDLLRVFELAHESLRDKGIYAFSTEALIGEAGYKLRDSGRYAHEIGYIRELASKVGFSEISTASVELRREAGNPMMGNIYIYKKQ